MCKPSRWTRCVAHKNVWPQSMCIYWRWPGVQPKALLTWLFIPASKALRACNSTCADARPESGFQVYLCEGCMYPMHISNAHIQCSARGANIQCMFPMHGETKQHSLFRPDMLLDAGLLPWTPGRHVHHQVSSVDLWREHHCPTCSEAAGAAAAWSYTNCPNHGHNSLLMRGLCSCVH